MHKFKKVKRILSVFLVSTLIFGTMPDMAYAKETIGPADSDAIYDDENTKKAAENRIIGIMMMMENEMISLLLKDIERLPAPSGPQLHRRVLSSGAPLDYSIFIYRSRRNISVDKYRCVPSE